MPSQNATLIQNLYADFKSGNVPGVLAAMSPDIVWMEAENFPYADRNPYRGPQAVLEGVFMRLATEWDGFATVPDEILDAGDTIVALGHYTGTFKATAKPMRAQMVHVWRIADGKAAAFRQYADTLQVARVTGAV